MSILSLLFSFSLYTYISSRYFINCNTLVDIYLVFTSLHFLFMYRTFINNVTQHDYNNCYTVDDTT